MGRVEGAESPFLKAWRHRENRAGVGGDSQRTDSPPKSKEARAAAGTTYGSTFPRAAEIQLLLTNLFVARVASLDQDAASFARCPSKRGRRLWEEK
jgi:hypothetical protein